MKDFLSEKLIVSIDAQRTLRGFMTISELLEIGDAKGNIIFDPFSVLVSKHTQLGEDNIFYPNVIIEVNNGGAISIGSHNVFFPGSILLADGGKIVIEDGNELGEGGVRIKANTPKTLVEINSRGRYMGGAEITGRCQFGSGSQIIGAIRVQNCHLGAGDSYKEPNPETRGGVLKGFGQARNLIVQQGKVINGQGNFEQSRIEDQIVYHPK